MRKPIFTIFYAWQSDRPQNHNRKLVAESLQQATEALNSDPNVPYEVAIDQDTKDEPGLCDIPATILRKIGQADAFLCDLTFVAKTDDGKHCSNPNVLFELGYAFKSLGHERILCVINEAHGEASNQMFDLAHRRHPHKFQSPSEARTRNETLAALSKSLVEMIKPVLALGQRSQDGAADRFDKLRTEFEERVRRSDFHKMTRRHGALVITISASSGTKISPDILMKNAAWAPGDHGTNPRSRGNSIVCTREEYLQDREERVGVAESFDNGTILLADTLLFNPMLNPRNELSIQSTKFDHTIVDSVFRSLQSLNRMGGLLPWTVSVSVLEVSSYWFATGGFLRKVTPFEGKDCKPPSVDCTNSIDDRQQAATLLRPVLDFIWKDFGFERGSNNFREDGFFDVHY